MDTPEVFPPPRSPYIPAAERQSFDVKLTASCHCGRVKYDLDTDEPLNTKFCHCRDCQILHGMALAKTSLLSCFLESSPYMHGTGLLHVTVIDQSTGASFQHAAIFAKESLAFTKESVPFISCYSSSTGRTDYALPAKLRCSYCGTLILDEGRKMILLFPSLIQFETEEARKKFQVR